MFKLTGSGRNKYSLVWVALMLSLLALSACGETTGTPASITTAAVTTTATTTAVSTRAASTTATAATTMAGATVTNAAGAVAGVVHPTETVTNSAGKNLVIGTIFVSSGLDPARDYTQTALTVFHSVYQTLVTYKGADMSKVVPDLANSWTISADGKTYTFKLKSGAKFASGNPVTADDVVFSYQRLKNLKGQPAFLTDNMVKFEASDPATVVVSLKDVAWDTMALLATPSFSILDSKTARSNGATNDAEADKSDKAATFLSSQSLGSGPFVLKSFQPGAEIRLEKNPNYGSPVAYDSVTLKNQPDVSVQQAALQKGEIDFAFDLGFEQVASLKGAADVIVTQTTSLTVFWMLMNVDPAVSEPTFKPEVRQAIRYALNYQDYLALGGLGAAQPSSIIPAGFLGALDKSAAVPTDLAKAKDLLAKAGYKDGFKIKMSYPADRTKNGVKFETLAQKIKTDLAQVNIQVELDPKTTSAWLSDYQAGKQPLTLALWSPDYNDPSDYLDFFPGQPVALRAGWKAGADPEEEDLARKARIEIDNTTRLGYYQQLQKLLNERGPYAPFLQPSQVLAYRSNLSGVTYNPFWVLTFNDIVRK